MALRPRRYRVQGPEGPDLLCVVCKHDRFHSAAAGFDLPLIPLRRESPGLTCAACGYVHLFDPRHSDLYLVVDREAGEGQKAEVVHASLPSAPRHVSLDAEALARVEKQLDLRLPKAYRDLLTDYPSALLETDAPRFELLLDADRLIAENLRVRDEPQYGLDWPRNLILIGDDGAGDVFAISTSGFDAEVRRLDREVPAFVTHEPDLGAFVASLTASYRVT